MSFATAVGGVFRVAPPTKTKNIEVFMAFIVCIDGNIASGKTTVLQEIEKKGYKVFCIRSLLK